MKQIVTLLALALTGCATVDYCDMTQEARCEWEARLENRINDSLDSIESKARVDVVVRCPNEPGLCPAPDVVTSEAGDATILTIPVRP